MVQDPPRADTASLAFKTPLLSHGTLQVRKLMGREEISHPFSFQVSLISEERALDLDALVGQPAQLSIRGLDGTRTLHGVIERFRHVVSGRRYVHYEATLVSPLKLLHYTRNSRIFQQRSTPEIVQEVLTTIGLEVRLALMETYGPRDYCVQYQESDLDFVSRLLEEDGILSYLDHTGDHPVLVLGDGPHAIDPLPQISLLEFRAESLATIQQKEALYDFRAEASLRSGGAVLRDFRFKNPGVSLEMSRAEARFPELETFYYPGGYVSSELGKSLAKVRLEQQVRDRQRFTAVATIRGLMPGYRFTLEGHDRDDFNRSYLICAVEHEGTEAQALLEETGTDQTVERTYRARLECIPIEVPFRPTMVTPRPFIPGLQTAVVVGPGTEEIHCDTFGRVKVRFHWDRTGCTDDKASCWIRVGQGWGGPGFGSVFVPRIGQEVMIQFIEGDPDRPLIVGVVYNGQNMPPYPLPEGKTRSGIKSRTTPGGNGFNELRFEDIAGKEEVFLHGELDMNTVIKRDHTQQYGRDRDTDIGRHNTIKVAKKEVVEVGDTQHLTVGSNRTVQVKGNQQTQIDQNQVISVTQNQIKQVGGAKTQLVQGANTEIFQSVNHILTKSNKFEMTGGNSHQHTANLSRMSQQDLFVNTNGHNFITSQKTATVHSGTIHIQATGPGESAGALEGLSAPTNSLVATEQGGGMMGGLAGGLAGGMGELMPNLADLFSNPFGMEAGIESMISGALTGFMSGASDASGVGDAMSAVAGAAAQAGVNKVVSPNAQKLLGLLGMGFAAAATEAKPEDATVDETGFSIVMKAKDHITANFGKTLVLTRDKPEEDLSQGPPPPPPPDVDIKIDATSITLRVGKHSIKLDNSTGITIESPQLIDIKGKPIKLNC